jgi:hypothetical protein
MNESHVGVSCFSLSVNIFEKAESLAIRDDTFVGALHLFFEDKVDVSLRALVEACSVGHLVKEVSVERDFLEVGETGVGDETSKHSCVHFT